MMSRKKLKKKVRKIKSRLDLALWLSKSWRKLALFYIKGEPTARLESEQSLVQIDSSEPQASGEWQPIETLGLQNEHRGWVLVWSVEDDRVREIWGDNYFANKSDYQGDITHWMPLPKGPFEVKESASAKRSLEVAQ